MSGMRRGTRMSRIGLVLLSVTAGLSCGKGRNVVTEAEEVKSVRVTTTTGARTVVVAGATLKLQAEALNASGDVISAGAPAWSSRTPAVATVSPGGVVTGVGPGPAEIQAVIGRVTGVITVEAVLLQFVPISAGSFQMGSTSYPSEQPVHSVTISQAFRLQSTEVTQTQWQAVMGTNPSRFTTCGPACPVEQVSWDDIQSFLGRLNQVDPGQGYRLATEAEWEYAARAETTGDFGGTGVLDQMGWYSDNSSGTTHPVGQKQANAWGLYDMHGNALEWVEDWYDAYSASPSQDPRGPATGTARVLRGGSWLHGAFLARSAFRFYGSPSVRNAGSGFRLARTP